MSDLTGKSSPTTLLVEQFAELFAGRTDAYGTEEGGCIRVADESEDWRYFMAHLDGETPIGVYPLVPRAESGEFSWVVKWGAVDLDVKAEGKRRYDFECADDALIAARNLVAVLASFGVTSWIERTKSGGYHVWVFASEWVSAATMRRALIVACRIGNVPTTEVNPKAESFDDPSSLGNYVRLMYPGALGPDGASPYTRVVLGEHEALMLHEFVDRALASRCTSATLESIAALYIEDKPLPRARTMGAVGQVDISKEITDKMSPLTYHIFTHGPSEQSDRSTTLARLAYKCRDDGLSEDEAEAVLVEADISWGKFHSRKNGERELLKMVEKAYS